MNYTLRVLSHYSTTPPVLYGNFFFQFLKSNPYQLSRPTRRTPNIRGRTDADLYVESTPGSMRFRPPGGLLANSKKRVRHDDGLSLKRSSHRIQYIMNTFTIPSVKAIAKSIDSYVRQADFVAAQNQAIEFVASSKGTAEERAKVILAIRTAAKHKNKWFFINLAACIVAGITISIAFGPTTGWTTVLKLSIAFLAGLPIGMYCEKRGNEQALATYYELSSRVNDEDLAILSLVS